MESAPGAAEEAQGLWEWHPRRDASPLQNGPGDRASAERLACELLQNLASETGTRATNWKREPPQALASAWAAQRLGKSSRLEGGCGAGKWQAQRKERGKVV